MNVNVEVLIQFEHRFNNARLLFYSLVRDAKFIIDLNVIVLPVVAVIVLKILKASSEVYSTDFDRRRSPPFVWLPAW